MKKILYITANFIATTLICTDFLYKTQNSAFPESLSTVFIMLFFAIVITIMARINISHYKKKGGIIFRPPFFKMQYFKTDENAMWQRIKSYSLFGVLVGVLFYLTRSSIVWTIPQVVEILAISFMAYVLIWGIYEHQVESIIKIKTENSENPKN